MTRSIWPICRKRPNRNTPAVDPTKPPTSSMNPILKSTLSRCQWREHAGDRRGDDLVRLRRDGDRRRHADEDQQRRQQETAADAEHAGKEADAGAEPQQHEDVEGHLGDRQVDLHGR